MNVPHMNGSPQNSTPNSPADHLPPPRSGHRRTDSVTIEGDDYFLPAGRVSASNVASAPVTPQSARNISFSPRIQFHDTFPSGEYDRRGEASTCNRLTPLLAQQIKEELNTFKMVSQPQSAEFAQFSFVSLSNPILSTGNGSSRILKGVHTLLLTLTNLHVRRR